MAVVENFTSSGSISKSIDYGSNPVKSGKTIGIGCSDDKDQAINDFSTPFILYGKDKDDVKVHRFVISFANTDDDNSELNDFDSFEYVRKFLTVLDKSLDSKFPIFAVQNTNTNHVHYHVYIGACGIDGIKFHPKWNPISFCRNLNDQLSLSYGLKPVPSYQQDYKNIKQFTDSHIEQYAQKHDGHAPYGYKDDARQKISRAVVRSSTLSGFKKVMLDQDSYVGNNLSNSNKMLNIYIPYRYKSGFPRKSKHEKKQSYRNLRTRTLGEQYFSKDAVKRAIYSKDKDVLKPYEFFARDMNTVQGGKYQSKHFSGPAILVKHPAKIRMQDVPYVSDRKNYIYALTYGRKHFHSMGISDITHPNLNGFDSEERQEIVKLYKAYENIIKIEDDFFNSISGIFHSFSRNISKATNKLSYSKNRRQGMSFVYDTGVGDYNNHYNNNHHNNSISNNNTFNNSDYAMRDRTRRLKEEKKNKIKQQKQEIDPLAGITNADLDKYKTPAEKQVAARKLKNENSKNLNSKLIENNEVENVKHKYKRKHRRTYHGFKM